MRRCRRRWVGIPLLLLVVGIGPSNCGAAEAKAIPEFDLYVTHNAQFRSRFVGNGTYSDPVSEFTTASFEYDVDIGLLSFFRRYIFKDPDLEKSKRISFRLGYAYFADLTTHDASADEHRGLGEITFRFPMGNAWLLADRNRGELRRVNDSTSSRYRNRLRLERSVVIGNFRMTPYATTEAYYDSRVDQWNQWDATAGAEFPWYHKTILEFYVTWQEKQHTTDTHIFGFTLQKFL